MKRVSRSWTRRAGLVVGLLVAGGGIAPPSLAGDARGAAAPPLFETRVRSVSVEGSSLSGANVQVEMALRASRSLTVRRMSFSDSSVEGVPLWIDDVDGEWRLRAGEEFLLPHKLRARVSTLDALQVAHLARAIGRRSVTVRTTVELSVAAPWTARLFFSDPTRPAVLRAEVSVPIDAGPGLLQPVLALSAVIGERLRDRLGPLVSGLRDLAPARRALIDDVSPSIASVRVAWDIETRTGERLSRSRRALGFAWNDSTLCTTHEALEPWRFDFSEAALLQVQGARLAPDSVRLEVIWPKTSTVIDAEALRRQLPRGRTRTVFTPVDQRVRRVSVVDRDTAENVVCLGIAAPGAPAGWHREGGGGASDLAAFVSRESGGVTLAWTSIAPAAPGERSAAATRLTTRLNGPLAREAFGSPLVFPAGQAGPGLAGIVLSERRVAPIGDVERAALRRIPVSAR
jgi:hypothetical protein